RVDRLGICPALDHRPALRIVSVVPGGRLPRAHVDRYRLDAPHDQAPFLRDVLYGEGVAAVEWFDRLGLAAGDDEALLVTLRFTPGGGRAIRLEARGARHERLLE